MPPPLWGLNCNARMGKWGDARSTSVNGIVADCQDHTLLMTYQEFGDHIMMQLDLYKPPVLWGPRTAVSSCPMHSPAPTHLCNGREFVSNV